jgi:CubicO group peptidase (beta-lactamase class C family)
MKPLVLCILGGVLLCSKAVAADGTAPENVARLLESIRAKYKLPSLAVAVVFDGKIVATNAVGVRKQGNSQPVQVDDRYHLGSITKSMTATVAAMQVEQGKISWSTTVAEMFPDLKGRMHSNYLGVTLEQLLSHRGGAPAEPPPDLWLAAWQAKGTPAEQRLAFATGILARKPQAEPGTKFIYSNQGYTIAGVMLEKAAGNSWEELMGTMLFEPLGMKSAGFGAPASPGKVDQPWGHTSKLLSGLKPVPPGPEADNPLAISPAGAVHCSMEDLARYVLFHLAGERGEGRLLKTETFKKLHEPVGGGDYALGWVVLERKWAHGRALMHNGSNTMFYAVIWAAPKRNCAVIVATNTGSNKADQACDDAATQVAELWGF